MSDILQARSTSGITSPTPSRMRPSRDKLPKAKDFYKHIREQRARDPKVYAAVQKALKPLKPGPNVLKQPMLAERNSDLRAICSKTAMNLRRWFREGEMVWCALDTPITLPDADGINIRYWPALVEQIKLKTIPVRRKGDALTQPIATTSSSRKEVPQDDGTGRGIVIEEGNDDPPLPWTVKQSTTYKVQLLAVSHSYTIADEHVLPYQAHAPSTQLIAALQDFPPENLEFNREQLSKFNPCAPSTSFKDAVAPYAMAVQIGSLLSGFWSFTDEWEFKYTTPIHPTPSQNPIQTAIEATGRHNAQTNALANDGSPSFYTKITTTNPNMTLSEAQAAATQVLGVPLSSGLSDSFTQIRFQGLWWGAERIWVDDFVRLKSPRRSLAPRGAQNILPPAGPGKGSRELWIAQGKEPDDVFNGAGGRGVFLKLDGLFVVDTPREGGVLKKEGRASGMLYELAELDWEEPGESTPQVNGAHTYESASSSGSLPRRTTSQNGDSSLPSTSSSNLPGSNSQQWGPPAYLLPKAPAGYKFRPILSPGHEAVVNLGLISGRYYPGILHHPHLRPLVQQAMESGLDSGRVMQSNNLWALEGLSAGYHNAVDPTSYKKSRTEMVQDADKIAGTQLEEHKQQRISNRDVAMSEEKYEPKEEAETERMDIDD